MRLFLHIALLMVFSISCTGKKTVKECLEYYKKHKEEFVVSKVVSGFEVKMEYIPKHLFASADPAIKPNGDLNFVLTIAPIKDYDDEYKATMFEKISKFEEYKERVFNLNFEMNKLVELSLDDKPEVYVPVLFNTENTYGLTKEIKINLIFAAKSVKGEFKEAHKIDVVFTDEIFETGISHFVFDNHIINNISQLVCSVN